MLQSDTKGIQYYAWLGGKGDSMGIVQEYMYKPECVLEKESRQFLWDFDILTGKLILSKYQELLLKRNCDLVDVAVFVPTGHKSKRQTNTWILLENWNSNGIWKWRWYQL